MSICSRAIDIGGNGVRRADVCGTEVRNIEKMHESAGGEKAIEELLRFAVAELPGETRGIAYSVAGVIDGNDVVKESPNAHFLDGVSLAGQTRAMAAKNKRQVVSAVFNDMEAAVTGMATLFPGQPYFMGITWSSGIGLRIWKDGRILSVAEGGHMLLDPSPFAPVCGDGRRGHAEAIIGGDAVKRRIIAETQTLGIALPGDIHPCAFLDHAYVNGTGKEKQWAEGLYNMVGYGMGIFLANIQSLLNLPLIIWKGSFARGAFRKDGPNIEPVVRKAMQEILIDPTWASEDHLDFQLITCENNEDAFIGAAEALNALQGGK